MKTKTEIFVEKAKIVIYINEAVKPNSIPIIVIIAIKDNIGIKINNKSPNPKEDA